MSDTKHTSASDILDEASETIKARGEERDKGSERSMRATVDAFNALTGHQMTETQGWQFMVILKLARANGGKFKMDDYLDGAAYIALAGECESKNKSLIADKNTVDQQYTKPKVCEQCCDGHFRPCHFCGAA